MLEFPDILKVALKCNNEQALLNNIVVKLRLFAARKNNYSILKLSDDFGELFFSKTDALNEIDESMNMFLMDYASQLHECMDYIDIEICFTKDVENAIKGMNRYLGIIQSITKEKIELVKNSQNHLFYPKKVRVYLKEPEKSKEVIIEINEKK